MTQTNPTISVVLPVLNGVKTIEKAIRSILDQNYEPIELIVLDAGSTDGTVGIIEKYNDKIAYWHSRPDGSCGLAINIGMKKANGELVAQLMADDWFEPGTFNVIAEAYQEIPGVDIITCGGRFVYYDDQSKQYLTKLTYNTPSVLAITLKNMCYGIPAMSSRFIAKKFIEKRGVFDALDDHGRHNYSADREYLIRAALLGCHNVIVPHLGHTYFIHESSATFGNNPSNQMKIFKEHLALVTKYEKTYPEAKENEFFFKRWYAHQAVRLFTYQCILGKFSDASLTIKDGFLKAKWLFLMEMILLPIQRLYKKMGSLGRKILLRFDTVKSVS